MKFQPGPAWLLLSKTDPPFSPSLYQFQGKRGNEGVSTTPSAAMSIDTSPVFTVWRQKKKSSVARGRKAVYLGDMKAEGVRARACGHTGHTVLGESVGGQ